MKKLLFFASLGGGYALLHYALGFSEGEANLGAWVIGIGGAFAYHLIRTRRRYGDYEYRSPDERGF
jgi:hypothetical protein